MGRLGIVSDNMIGANDSGVKFSKYGLTTFVALNLDILNSLNDSVNVISINTNTRNSRPIEAYRCVTEATRKLKNMGISYFYKKIDSTLRGNPGIEIQAIMDTLQLDMCIIAPSFPENGRIVEGGYLFTKNIKDDSSGYPICHIPTMLQNEIDTQVGLIEINDVRAGAKHLSKKLHELKTTGMKLIVIDAVYENDLNIIANAIKDYSKDCLIAGSAGLTAHLPLTLDFAENGERFPIRRKPSVLVLAATFNQTTAHQVMELKNMDEVKTIELNTSAFLRGEEEEAFGKVLLDSEKSLQNNYTTVIVTDTLLKDREELERYKIWENVNRFGSTLANKLGNIAKELILKGLVTDVIITGGGTASHAIVSMSANGIILEKELLPGIPLGKLKGGECEGINIVTKAGGFGEKDALVKVVSYLRNNSNYAIVE